MKKLIAITYIAAITALPAKDAFAADGLIAVESPHDVATTVDKLVAVLESKGMNIFARINHEEGASKAGMKLRPTELLVFGNPKVGTPLMLCSQSFAIDLPQKMLAWQDENGKVHLGYNDPMHLKDRHNPEGCNEVLGKVSDALSNFAAAATKH